MAADKKKTKSATTAKESSTAKIESPAAKDAAKPEAAQTADAAPANYSRGEGQKPVTDAYRENWNAIFAKKSRSRKR